MLNVSSNTLGQCFVDHGHCALAGVKVPWFPEVEQDAVLLLDRAITSCCHFASSTRKSPKITHRKEPMCLHSFIIDKTHKRSGKQWNVKNYRCSINYVISLNYLELLDVNTLWMCAGLIIMETTIRTKTRSSDVSDSAGEKQLRPLITHTHTPKNVISYQPWCHPPQLLLQHHHSSPLFHLHLPQFSIIFRPVSHC